MPEIMLNGEKLSPEFVDTLVTSLWVYLSEYETGHPDEDIDRAKVLLSLMGERVR